MTVQVLNVVTSWGVYDVTTESGAVYTLELLPGETTTLYVEGGSKQLEKSLYILHAGIVEIGQRMKLEDCFSGIFDKCAGIKTSPVTRITPVL